VLALSMIAGWAANFVQARAKWEMSAMEDQNSAQKSSARKGSEEETQWADSVLHLPDHFPLHGLWCADWRPTRMRELRAADGLALLRRLWQYVRVLSEWNDMRPMRGSALLLD